MRDLRNNLAGLGVSPDAAGPAVSSAEIGTMIAALRGEQQTANAFDRKTYRQLIGHLTKLQAYLQRSEQGQPGAADLSSPVALARALVANQPGAGWPHDSAANDPNPPLHGLQPASRFSGLSVAPSTHNLRHMAIAINEQGAGAVAEATLDRLIEARRAYLEHLNALHAKQLAEAKARGMSGSARRKLRAEQARVRKTYLDAMGTPGWEFVRDRDTRKGFRFATGASGEIGAEAVRLKGLKKAEETRAAWTRRADTAAGHQAQFETKKRHWGAMTAGAAAFGFLMLSATGLGVATLPLLFQASTALATWTSVGAVVGGVAFGGATGHYAANRVQGLRGAINGVWLRAAENRRDKAERLQKAALAYYGLDSNAPAANEDFFRTPVRNKGAGTEGTKDQPAAGETAPSTLVQPSSRGQQGSVPQPLMLPSAPAANDDVHVPEGGKVLPEAA